MDAKDIHNLSEAYREVYAPQEDLDEAEGSYGQTPKARAAMGKLAIARREKPVGEYGKRGEKTKQVKAIEKHTRRIDNGPDAGHSGKRSTSPRWSGYLGAKGRGKMDDESREWSRERSEIYGGGNVTVKSGSVTKNPKKLRKQKALGEIGEQVDTYDIILSHLLDEGYAETQKAAEAIMVNMSEEWRDDIMEREDSPYEKASDAALDKRYGYGRASGDKRSFGRAANRSSAAAALRALRRGERSGSGTSTEAGADAVHRGWAKTAETSTDQTPEKKAKRAKLANTEYKDLPDDEKEKDRVSFNAVKAVYKNRNR